jgi:hypothetical protein
METSTKMKRNGGSRRSKHAADSTMVEQELHEQIARRAYAIYEKRGCAHGRDVEDWLESERLVVEQFGPRRSIGKEPPKKSHR